MAISKLKKGERIETSILEDVNKSSIEYKKDFFFRFAKTLLKDKKYFEAEKIISVRSDPAVLRIFAFELPFHRPIRPHHCNFAAKHIRAEKRMCNLPRRLCGNRKGQGDPQRKEHRFHDRKLVIQSENANVVRRPRQPCFCETRNAGTQNRRQLTSQIFNGRW